ncbi:helix-turn-helix domain-containing protein [Methylobacterium durans]|uniref:helix-turn-helix domain-containing protein n=1 Tax=Methylobacterium durans TaxID=2202825 RepID=UPI001F34B852|nr:response regulator transcription factor [Methylobacterium durans]
MTSFLSGTRFRVAGATASEMESGSADDAPRLILASLDDAASVDSARALRAARADSILVIFGRADAPTTLPRDLCLMAQAVLDRDIGRDTLVKVLDAVMSGVTVQSANLFSWMIERPRTAPEPLSGSQQIIVAGVEDPEEPPCHPLSSRELNVLRCLADGASNKVIALKFDLAEATVKIHVKNILRKLKTQNRTQAAIWAREHGIYPK